MKRILVAVDASPRTPLVLDTARDLASQIGGRLVLFRSVGLPTHIDEEAVAHAKEPLLDSLQHEAEADLQRHEAASPPGLIEKRIVHVGIAWESICKTAKDENVDLIVIGSHGYGGLDRLLGTTAAKVVNHADRNVLVVRPR